MATSHHHQPPLPLGPAFSATPTEHDLFGPIYDLQVEIDPTTDVLSVIGRVSLEIKQAHGEEAARRYRADAMAAASHEALMAMSRRTVHLVERVSS